MENNFLVNYQPDFLQRKLTLKNQDDCLQIACHMHAIHRKSNQEQCFSEYTFLGKIYALLALLHCAP